MNDFKNIADLRIKNKNLENEIEKIEISMIKSKIKNIFKSDILFYTIPLLFSFFLFFVFFAVQGYLQEVNFLSYSEIFTTNNLRNIIYLEFFIFIFLFFIRLKREDKIKENLDLFKKENNLETKVKINYLYSGYDLSFLAVLLIVLFFDLVIKSSSFFVFYCIVLSFFPMIGLYKKNLYLKTMKNNKNKIETTKLLELKEEKKIGIKKEDSLILNLIENKEKIKSTLSYYKEDKMTQEDCELFNLIIKRLEEKNKVIINKNKNIKKVNDLYENIFNEETKVSIITE